MRSIRRRKSTCQDEIVCSGDDQVENASADRDLTKKFLPQVFEEQCRMDFRAFIAFCRRMGARRASREIARFQG